MANTQSTYKKHVDEVTSYGWTPMGYDLWLAWRVNKRVKDLTEQDRAAHPKD
jgi:hypothetical protein